MGNLLPETNYFQLSKSSLKPIVNSKNENYEKPESTKKVVCWFSIQRNNFKKSHTMYQIIDILWAHKGNRGYTKGGFNKY